MPSSQLFNDLHLRGRNAAMPPPAPTTPERRYHKFTSVSCASQEACSSSSEGGRDSSLEQRVRPDTPYNGIVAMLLRNSWYRARLRPRGLALMIIIRGLSLSCLACSLFWLSMYRGRWFREDVLNSKYAQRLGYTLGATADDHGHTRSSVSIHVKDTYTQIVLFTALPVILAASLGALYEALWIRSKERGEMPSGRASPDSLHRARVIGGALPSPIEIIQSVVRFQFRPLFGFSPWVSVGEFAVLLLWVATMATQLCQHVQRHDASSYYARVEPCSTDPAAWCWIKDGQPATTWGQYRLKTAAVGFGFLTSAHFGAILIPVSRDSKFWSAVGIPFERAVLYHATAGRLAFICLFLHLSMFVTYWVWEKGWSHALRESLVHDVGDKIDVRAGWMAFFCAVPIWVTSVNYVRRRWYSVFKRVHWLFVGLFLFSVMHWAPNVLYYMGGLSLYTMHVFSRLSAWKRWRIWNKIVKRKSPGWSFSDTNVVNAVTNESYTRLVLHNPKREPARGGSFVYLSAPDAIGTGEAHAITVAVRGPPPATVLAGNVAPDDVFTVYVKAVGPWTKGLRAKAKGVEEAAMDLRESAQQENGNEQLLVVDVDGFYSHVDSFNSMMAAGSSRLLVIAGGSGVTSFLGFIQDWCIAAAEGHPVPEVHLAWCCRDLAEMELVGESLPSLLASTRGTVKESCFTLSLFCSGKVSDTDDALSVTWPLDDMYCTTRRNVRRQRSCLNDSFRVLLAGGAAYVGWLLGLFETSRRGLKNTFQEGALSLTLVVVTIVSALVVYGWLGSLLSQLRIHRRSSCAKHAYELMMGEYRDAAVDEEQTTSCTSCATAATYPVEQGRVPSRALLAQEALAAKERGLRKVKVLVSGPNELVDTVLSDARAIDWRLFDTQAYSFEF